jgi:hypothetical protein
MSHSLLGEPTRVQYPGVSSAVMSILHTGPDTLLAVVVPLDLPRCCISHRRSVSLESDCHIALVQRTWRWVEFLSLDKSGTSIRYPYLPRLNALLELRASRPV